MTAWVPQPDAPNPWVSTVGTPLIWTPVDDCCGAPVVNVTVQQKTQTLYYIAGAGQTAFSLSAADMFGNNVLLDPSTALAVSKGGLRLVPDDGSGAGGYTTNFANNAINLLWPAGAGEILVVDLFWVAEPVPAPVSNQTIGQDVLAISAPNTLPPLSRAPDGRVFILFLEGRPFFATVPSPAFTYSGTTITWISTIYSVQPGDEVVAVYTS